MKNKNYALIVMALLLISGCHKPVSPVTDSSFVTGYDDIVIESKTKPESIEGLEVFGYYSDINFENEYNFDKEVEKIYVKGLKGKGTKTEPYLIENEVSFNTLAHFGDTLDKYFRITKDFEITPRYTNNYVATTFEGELDGLNHTITLRTYLENDISYGYGNTGLLYKIGENGVVNNLKIVGALNGEHASIGSLANFNYGVINNVYTYGVSLHKSNGYNSGIRLMTTYDDTLTSIIDDFGRVGVLEDLTKGGAGGIVGTNYGAIQDCFNRMMVSATIGGGGIAGINHGIIFNCYNKGAIGTTGNYCVNSSFYNDPAYDFSYIGGISGANYGSIFRSINLNTVFVARIPWKYGDNPAGYSDYCNRIRVGGIAGANFGTYDEELDTYSGGRIEECVNYGRVHGDMQVGGIAGYSSGYVADCEAICSIGARMNLGGIVGWQSGDKEGDRISVVTHCYACTRCATNSVATPMDKDGNTMPFYKFEQLSSTVSESGVVEYYNISKYATYCVYNSNSGTSLPLDPETNEQAETITNSPSKFSDSTKRDLLAKVEGVDSGIWAEFIAPEEATAIVGFNSSWTCHLNVILAWQQCHMTFVTDRETKSIVAVAGVDYVNTVEALNAGSYIHNLDSNYSCAKKDKFPSLLENEIWVTEEGNINSIWDGFAVDGLTVYAMAK